MFPSSYFPRAYFGVLADRRAATGVDLSEVVRQLVLRVDRLEQLVLNRG